MDPLIPVTFAPPFSPPHMPHIDGEATLRFLGIWPEIVKACETMFWAGLSEGIQWGIIIGLIVHLIVVARRD